MGLTLQDNLVLVDHTHNRLLNTSLNGNPKYQNLGGNLNVYSIFERHKSPHKAKKSGGDNCHLLYALKGKDGLETTFSSIKSLIPNFREILKVLPVNGYDLVVSMPSSHAISRIFASRLAKNFSCALDFNVFNKITPSDALLILKEAQIPTNEKTAIRGRIKRQVNSGQPLFALKDVPARFRHHFEPLIMQTAPSGAFNKILLADDLLATGTTLLNAQRLIANIFPNAQIDAACLFSGV